MRPDFAAAGIAQDQLIVQLDMLRLGFVAVGRLASPLAVELIEEQLGRDPAYIQHGLAHHAD